MCSVNALVWCSNFILSICRAVFQFYPETPSQMEMITTAAMKCGFGGGCVIDYPNSTKASKCYLVLFAGIPAKQCSLPQGKGDHLSHNNNTQETIRFTGPEVSSRPKNKSRRSHGASRRPLKDRDWVQAKKERMRKQGRNVANDSKYSTRRRRPVF